MLPLSFAERRLWFMQTLVPGNSFYNIIIPVEFKETIDIKSLHEAINEIIERQEIFRTSYHEEDGYVLEL